MARRNFVPDIARTRMQHQPDIIVGVKANFDKMIAAAERAELLHRLRFAVLHAFVQIAEFAPSIPLVRLINRIFVFTKTDGNRAFDLMTQIF